MSKLNRLSSLLALVLMLGGTAAVAMAEDVKSQEVERAEAIQRRGTQLAQKVSRLLDEARNKNDIVLIQCLSGVLTQVNAQNRTIDDRVGSLRRAVAVGQPDQIQHSATLVDVAGKALDSLDSEAGSCIGQGLFDTGKTRTTTTVDENTTVEDPTGGPSDLPQIVPQLTPAGSSVL